MAVLDNPSTQEAKTEAGRGRQIYRESSKKTKQKRIPSCPRLSYSHTTYSVTRLGQLQFSQTSQVHAYIVPYTGKPFLFLILRYLLHSFHT